MFQPCSMFNPQPYQGRYEGCHYLQCQHKQSVLWEAPNLPNKDCQKIHEMDDVLKEPFWKDKDHLENYIYYSISSVFYKIIDDSITRYTNIKQQTKRVVFGRRIKKYFCSVCVKNSWFDLCSQNGIEYIGSITVQGHVLLIF